MTLVSIPLMDKTGRRTLHLYGLGGMFIFSIFITISFLIKASIGVQFDVFIVKLCNRRFESHRGWINKSLIADIKKTLATSKIQSVALNYFIASLIELVDGMTQ